MSSSVAGAAASGARRPPGRAHGVFESLHLRLNFWGGVVWRTGGACLRSPNACVTRLREKLAPLLAAGLQKSKTLRAKYADLANRVDAMLGTANTTHKLQLLETDYYKL